MCNSVSLSASGGGTSISVKRDRIFGGRSFFPTSVAGFMQANSLNSGWRGTGSNEPCSVNVMEAVGPCSKLDTHSSVSGLARLTSSSRILDGHYKHHGLGATTGQHTSSRCAAPSLMVPQRTQRQTCHSPERAAPRTFERLFQIQSNRFQGC